MRSKFLLTAVFFSAVLYSCKKDKTAPVSAQTLMLLQNKWALVSEVTVVPTQPTYNTTYTGAPTDYYLFSTEDTLFVHKRSPVYSYMLPITDTLPYSVRNDHTLAYGPNTNVEIIIEKLTTDSLILNNPVTVSFVNVDNSVTSYSGTKTITLAR
ncbi:MAG TPA: hypothetical protein VGM24_02035 [Puia sp.]|jgi:hypothetical protein